MSTFGENVKKYRILRGMTQAELAEKLGYKNKASIGKIENGNNEVLISMAIKIAKALGVDVMDLMHKKDTADEYAEYLPYLADASEETLRTIRYMLHMPEKKSASESMKDRA